MQKKTLATSVVLSAVVSVAGYSLAAAAPGEMREAYKDMREAQRGEAQQMRQTHKDRRVELREGQKAQRAELRSAQKVEHREWRGQMKEAATPQQRAALVKERRAMAAENVKERAELRAENIKERVQMRTQNAKERVELRRENRQERMEMRKEIRKEVAKRRAERFAAHYARATQKLGNVLTRLKAAGVDTAAIAPLLGTLDEKAVAVAAAYTAYEAAQDDKGANAAARTKLLAARDDFRTYYRGTVRPAIVAAVSTVLHKKSAAAQTN